MVNFTRWRESFHEYKLLRKDINFWQSFNKEQQIRFYNFWKSQDIKDMWLYQFVKTHFDLAPEKEIVFVAKGTYVEVWPTTEYDRKFGALNPDRISQMLAALKNRGN